MRFPRRSITFVAGGIAGFVFFGAFVQSAVAQARPAECYRFDLEDTPVASEQPQEKSEVWCYRRLESPPGATMIYNIDENGHTTPELSAIVERDGTLTHASLLSGELTVHRLRSNFNPLPVPIVPPSGAQRVPEPISPSSVASSDKALRVLTTTRANPQDITVRLDGVYAASSSEEGAPWRGYWFPYSSGRMYRGSNSPLAKYDRFVKARSGKNPGAQKWEATRHAPTEAKWSGHCNGWAASSILRPEPRGPWTDPLSGEIFTVGDMKGIFMERDWCPKLAFFGKRNRGGGDPRDIHPALFHNTLTYYLGQLKKPVLMDYMATKPVENRVVSGYEMKITQTAQNTYRVETALKVHEYDSKIINEPGLAPYKMKTYKYTIGTDDQGNVIKGSWISSNPDFLWVPISPGKCKDSNQAVSENWVRLIGRPVSLPW